MAFYEPPKPQFQVYLENKLETKLELPAVERSQRTVKCSRQRLSRVAGGICRNGQAVDLKYAVDIEYVDEFAKSLELKSFGKIEES